ncbi:hypothetical protein RvY_05090 [Ramazzottius varieornatus]|uniref:Uncharacterized protein n=1 Tax=Ramazzottius varieornatus TaxID=947166 RepID=A0A1D1V2X5_RAMVA|nr:hypothetical protein RvY_05090 [Ramazzottius varieornatus]
MYGSTASARDREAVSETDVGALPGDLQVQKRSAEELIGDELRIIAKTAFFTTLVHPFNFSQVLMQIGYEPFPARLNHDFRGRPVYYLASVFDYIQHIKQKTGTYGLFLGLGPTLVVTIGGIYTYRAAQKIVKYVYDEKFLGRPANFEAKRFGFLEPAESSRNASSSLRFAPRELVGITYTVSNFLEDLVKEITIVTASMVITWPLQVVAFRCMAQFIGGENIYNGVIPSLQEIVNTEGAAGFFKGLFPMWCSYVAITGVTYGAVFAYACYDTRNPINLKLIAAGAGAIANSFFYPLKLTARLFAIGGARLVAARPPRMPVFKEWRDLHAYLLTSGESKRGSSMLFRKAVSKQPGMFDSIEHGTSSLYKMSSSRGMDDWSQKYSSTQLLALEAHRRGASFRLNL